MYEENSRDTWEVVTKFLTEESFSHLCNHLLITLDERDLCKFLESLRKFLRPRIEVAEPKDVSNVSYLFEVILSKCSDSGSFDQILLLNAVLTKKRELLRLLRDEGGDEAEAKIKDIVTQICAIPDSGYSLTPLIKECFKPKNIEAIKLLGLQSWVLYYRISEECQALESWESFFTKNAINFRRSNSYALLDDALHEESDSEFDHGMSNKVKHNKKSRKKRKRKYGRDNRSDDVYVDFASTDDGSGPKVNHRSWSLYTDVYSITWSNVDLPEYLSRHCFSTWMRWILAKWVE